MDKSNTRKCPHCGEEILKEAKRCKHCQADIRSWIRKHPIYTTLICITLLGVFMPGVFDGDYIANIDTSNSEEEDHSGPAVVCAQNKVKSMLRSPSTADFPWTAFVEPTRLEDGSYLVSSHVDAQNGFGAIIRQNYTCQVILNDGGSVGCQANCVFLN